MIFKHQYEVVVKDLNNRNKVSNKAILGYMEEIASLHSATVGYGVNDVIENGTAWILLDWKLEVLQRCNYGEKVHLNTWVKQNEKFYSYRDYELFDEKDNLIAKGTSKWVLVDLETKRITKINEELANIYNPEYEKSVFVETKLEKVREPKEYISGVMYNVNRSDIDVNEHMHNLNYLDLAYEALPEEIYNNEELNNVRMNYKHELKFGDVAKCMYGFENNKHLVAIKSEDESKLHAIIELS